MSNLKKWIEIIFDCNSSKAIFKNFKYFEDKK